jgi:translation initiation factor 3 subunit G
MVQIHIKEKFGKAADSSRATGTSKASDEEIPLECTKKRVAVWDDDEIFWEESVDAIMGSNKKTSGSVWQRFRGGDQQSSEPSGADQGPTEDMGRSASGKYQPPSARRGTGGPPVDAGADDSTLRVSNLGERVTDGDLQILFQSFGRVQRIFVARTPEEPRVCKGFAFVTMTNRKDAERALKGLNGHGLDHLVMSVDWASASPPPPGGARPGLPRR